MIVGENRFIACNVAYELLNSNHKEKAESILEYLKKKAIFPLPKEAEKEESLLFFRYIMILKFISNKIKKNEFDHSQLEILVSKQSFVPFFVSHWLNSNGGSEDMKNNLSEKKSEILKLSLKKKLAEKKKNLIYLLVFEFSLENLHELILYSSEDNNDLSSDEEDSSDEENNAAPLFSVDTLGDFRHRKNSSYQKPQLDFDNQQSSDEDFENIRNLSQSDDEIDENPNDNDDSSDEQEQN